jgi:Kef-type K+ transport system membrane component KefB
MSPELSLIIIVAAAYLAAHVMFDWLGKRFRIVSGAEYLVLGILLGPRVSGFMTADVVASFAPFMILALGWTGATIGMSFHLPTLINTPARLFTIAIAEASLTFVVVSAVMMFAFTFAFSLTIAQVILPSIALGAIATATSSNAITLASDNMSDPIVMQLRTASLIDGALAILAFGLLLCVVHIDIDAGARNVTATEWAVLTLGIGVVGGSLFHLFLGREADPDRLFIGLAGAIILASGAASYLRLSPMLASLVIGAILVNTTHRREDLERVMRTVEKPLYFVLLLFAGASWQPSRYDWFLPVTLYVLIRLAAKIGAARLAARANASPDLLQADWGRGLIAQGTIALAIAMNYSLNDLQIVPNVVFTAAVVSVIITDFFGVRFVSGLTRSSLLESRSLSR